MSSGIGPPAQGPVWAITQVPLDHGHALLVVFQAMDAAGKDGVIRHVMSGVNPQSCRVLSCQHPSAQELRHDFLWRTTRDLHDRDRSIVDLERHRRANGTRIVKELRSIRRPLAK